MITDDGAKRLMAEILKQAASDYKNNKSCPPDCPMFGTCEAKEIDLKFCDARNFLHSAWCATLCDGIDIDYSKYILTNMERCKLSRNTFRYVEGELKDYKRSIEKLDRLKDEIINKAPKQEEVRGTDVGDPTANKVASILKDKEVQRLEKIIKAIGKIYDMCDSKKKIIIQEKYWNHRYTDAGIAEKLGIGESTVRRWKQNIIYTLAVEINYL